MKTWGERLNDWSQTIVAVGSIVFVSGVLYADVQDIKEDVSKSEGLITQTQVLEVKLANAEKSQEMTIKVLEKLSENVDKLGQSVARLEGQLK
jgi:hypothetical protein